MRACCVDATRAKSLEVETAHPTFCAIEWPRCLIGSIQRGSPCQHPRSPHQSDTADSNELTSIHRMLADRPATIHHPHRRSVRPTKGRMILAASRLGLPVLVWVGAPWIPPAKPRNGPDARNRLMRATGNPCDAAAEKTEEKRQSIPTQDSSFNRRGQTNSTARYRFRRRKNVASPIPSRLLGPFPRVS